MDHLTIDSENDIASLTVAAVKMTTSSGITKKGLSVISHNQAATPGGGRRKLGNLMNTPRVPLMPAKADKKSMANSVDDCGSVKKKQRQSTSPIKQLGAESNGGTKPVDAPRLAPACKQPHLPVIYEEIEYADLLSAKEFHDQQFPHTNSYHSTAFDAHQLCNDATDLQAQLLRDSMTIDEYFCDVF